MKFKPCPFCGSGRVRLLTLDLGWMMVECMDCGANKRQVTKYKRQMAAEWNQRITKE